MPSWLHRLWLARHSNSLAHALIAGTVHMLTRPRRVELELGFQSLLKVGGHHWNLVAACLPWCTAAVAVGGRERYLNLFLSFLPSYKVQCWQLQCIRVKIRRGQTSLQNNSYLWVYECQLTGNSAPAWVRVVWEFRNYPTVGLGITLQMVWELPWEWG